MLSMDGVMQAPGGPEEDNSDGFRYGGWVAPYGDEVGGKFVDRLMNPSDILLGRKTFQIWENYWPQHASGWPGINDVTKYVFSTTVRSSTWNGSVFLPTLEDIRRLKSSDGADIKVWGSSKLVQLLLMHDLVDELWLMTYPVILGRGKKLFDDKSSPRAFTMVEHSITSTGVVVAHYKKDGEVKAGQAGA